MNPLVVFVEDLAAQQSTQHAFIKSPVRIGRSELNDLPLPQPFVSTWHAVVQFDEQGVRYVDLGSTNGSALNGERLEKNVPAAVEPDSEVQIGNLRLRLAVRATSVRPDPPARPMTAFALNVSRLQLALAAGPGEAGEAPDAASAAEVPAAEGPAAAAVAETVDQVLASAAMDLDLLYASFRGTWEHLRGAIEQLTAGLDPAARALALSRLAGKYGALSQESQFRELCGQDQPEAAAPTASAPGESHPATGLLSAFAESYLPDPRSAETEAGAARLLGRTAEVLEAFGRAYLEMRKGYEEFGKEMGVRPLRAESPIERARDVKQLLASLLDLRTESRTGDLQSVFADLMVHQVALLNGVVEGARGLLEHLSPDALSQEVGQSRWPQPVKAVACWKAYQARWQDLADEEEAISDLLFGPGFARAYSAIVGQRAGEEKPPPAPAGPSPAES